MKKSSNIKSLYITGLAGEYPSYSISQDQFEEHIKRLYPEHVQLPNVQKLLRVNHETEIERRRMVLDFSKLSEDTIEPPSIDELSKIFRTKGIEITASACKKAIQEAQISVSMITHTVGVTCTDQGNPGYDVLVSQQLGLLLGVQRVLLHGVGCAGGLSALRTATDIAAAATQRNLPARVLIFACELCSLFFKAELHAACHSDEKFHIAPVLFLDAAAALVLFNRIALEPNQKPDYELHQWGRMMLPGTVSLLSYDYSATGLIANLSQEVPKRAVEAITPMFEQLRQALVVSRKHEHFADFDPSNFDWAIHPGGAAVLRSAQKALDLSDDHIRASLQVYRSNGNSSSATVLNVLHQLRKMGSGRDNVVATSFGPGMTIEMFIMRRYREPTTNTSLFSSLSIRRFILNFLLLSTRKGKGKQKYLKGCKSLDKNVFL